MIEILTRIMDRSQLHFLCFMMGRVILELQSNRLDEEMGLKNKTT